MNLDRITKKANNILQSLKEDLGIKSDKAALSFIVPHYLEVVKINEQLSNELQMLKIKNKLARN